ncbi:MAG: NUDIX hydrolase [Actinomycetia bacterium]|nr:NUDIX hydrolase [Actinomycetes bacterium]MCP4961580.1 NUDIX hydrolase [Actinomycetes bacterium]
MSNPAMTVRSAATVLLARDGDAGIEVFMLRRNLNSDFVGGAYVFPGGKVDESDRFDAELAAVCGGFSDADASARLGVESGGLAQFVAAIRECFEEAGVFLARNESGVNVALDDEPEFWADTRRDVYEGKIRIAQVCRDRGLELEVDQVEYFSHWITPVGPPRRFDTRFFVARMPDGQTPLHDGGETVASAWVSVESALERQRAGDFEMIFPTIMNLRDVSRFDTVDALMADAAGRTDIPAIMPRIVIRDGVPTPLIEGDEGFEEASDNWLAPDSIRP